MVGAERPPAAPLQEPPPPLGASCPPVGPADKRLPAPTTCRNQLFCGIRRCWGEEGRSEGSACLGEGQNLVGKGREGRGGVWELGGVGEWGRVLGRAEGSTPQRIRNSVPMREPPTLCKKTYLALGAPVDLHSLRICPLESVYDLKTDENWDYKARLSL